MGRLLRSITAEMLVLWDCGLHGYPLAVAIRERKAHFLSRVPASQTFAPIRTLPDGSVLARWYRDPPSTRRADSPFLLVRVITYYLDDAPTCIRLVTSLLAPEHAPALDLVCGYHERWEVESTFDELSVHQRLVTQPLRSRKPHGVVQEFYGLLLAHYVVRSLLVTAAQQHQLDPDRLSFVRAARLVSVGVLVGDLLVGEEQDRLVTEILTLLSRAPLPTRRDRAAPRARKRPWPKHGFRKRQTSYQITRLKPFTSRVTIHAPPPPAAA